MSLRDRIWVESGSFSLPSEHPVKRHRLVAGLLFVLYFAFLFSWITRTLKSPYDAIPLWKYPYYGAKWTLLYGHDRSMRKTWIEIFAYSFLPSFLPVCLVYRYITHTRVKDCLGILEGSAHWADRKEICNAGLLNGKGVYVGGWLDKRSGKIRPLRHNGPEHVMAVAPTRSGKGVSLVIPTLLTWEHSVFVLDIKGENWLLSSGWRSTKGPVLRFDPSDSSERGAHYNPLEEIHFAEDGGAAKDDEARDVQTIASLLVDPDGKGLEDHWAKTAFILLQGAILHMVYKGRREGRIYSLKDVRDCLTHGDNRSLAVEWLTTPHLKKGWNITATNMWQQSWEKDRPTGFCSDKFPSSGMKTVRTSRGNVTMRWKDSRTDDETLRHMSDEDHYSTRCDYAEMERSALGWRTNYLHWEHARPFIDEDGLCYTHPTVAAVATEIGNKDVREASSIISTAISYLGLWLDPVVEMNTARSTFHLRDLVDGEKPVSLYLVVPPSGLTRLRPLLRLVVSQMVFALTPPMVEMEDGSGVKAANSHRMLLLLDEFPTLAKLDLVQSALAYLGGYGVKTYIIIQSYKQLTDIYGQDETVSGNCHIHVAFAPNDESTARMLSERCGKTTIVTGSSHISGKRFAMKPLLKDSESVQYSTHGRELLTADECKRLQTAVKDSEGRMIKPGAMLTFAAGCAPIMGMQTPWFFDPELSERRHMPAPAKSSVISPAALPEAAGPAVERKDEKEAERCADLDADDEKAPQALQSEDPQPVPYEDAQRWFVMGRRANYLPDVKNEAPEDGNDRPPDAAPGEESEQALCGSSGAKAEDANADTGMAERIYSRVMEETGIGRRFS